MTGEENDYILHFDGNDYQVQVTGWEMIQAGALPCLMLYDTGATEEEVWRRRLEAPYIIAQTSPSPPGSVDSRPFDQPLYFVVQTPERPLDLNISGVIRHQREGYLCFFTYRTKVQDVGDVTEAVTRLRKLNLLLDHANDSPAGN